MAERTIKGILLDVDYSLDQKKEIVLNLFVKTSKGLETFEERKFKPYFYVVVSDVEKAKRELLAKEFGEEKVKISKIEVVKPKNVEHALKLYFRNTQEVVTAREHVESIAGVIEKREYDIPFTKRFMIDNGIEPMNGTELKVEGKEIIEAKTVEHNDVLKELNFVAYDLETYSPGRFSDPQKDPIISISIATRQGSEAFIWKVKPGKDNARYFGSEKEMVQAFVDRMKELQPDIVVTYNGDLFDFPYIKERGRQLKVDIRPAFGGYEPVEKRRGLDNAFKLKGLQHVDAYQLVRLLNRFGVQNLVKFDLESVNEAIYGEYKEKIYSTEINEIWNSGNAKDVDRLLDYNKKDSEVTLRLALDYLSLYVEFSKLVHETLYDSSRAGASQLVEDLLIEKSHQNNAIIPNKPSEGEVKQRMLQTYAGGYVKEPIPGLHENIAVLDFRSLHPSIMIAHNISPETLKCPHSDCATGKNLSPDKDWFCEKKEGFIPVILEEILKKRIEAKNEMKKHPKKSEEYRILNARQQALKILLNSHYGYLGYPRSRWYSRESARAITAWSRHYIRETTHKAEQQGFKPLYNDSISGERFITIMNSGGLIEVKNVEQLFNETDSPTMERNGKEEKLVTGVKALSVNPKTLKPEWKPINEIIRHKTNKKMFRINQKFGETVVTEDHSVLIEKNMKLVEVGPLNMNENNFFYTNIPVSSKEIKEIDLYKELKGYKYQTIYKTRVKTSQIHEEGGYLWFGWSNQKKRIKIKRFIKVDSEEFESLCRLLGAYIAEGSSSTYETTKTRLGAGISSSNVEWMEAIKEDYLKLFENANITIIKSTNKQRVLTYSSGNAQKTIQYEDNTHKIQLMNQLSAVFFKVMCGQKSRGKRLPTFAFNVPEKYKKIILEKMIEGDGCKLVNEKLGYSQEYINKNFCYTTSSLGLASGVSLLLKQLGRNHTIQYRPSKKCYAIRTSDKYNKRVRRKVSQENYIGFVYDLNVEGNNNFVDSCGQILLHNTDSAFIILPKEKGEKDAREFVAKVNEDLPGAMELEFEGIYKRGIFVTKKQGGAAKKRYALVDYDGNFKIVGFEYVRRDWAPIAKNTQKSVIEAVLKEGNPEKAIKIVREVVERLRKGEVPKKELTILTQIKKPINKYESIGPHIAAAMKAIKRGKDLSVGSTISFIITRTGKSISDRAELEEYVKEGDYDADYYITHQVVPAVGKIISEFGVSSEDLIHGGTQKSLSSFM